MNPLGIVTADFNGDGALDLAVASFDSGEILLFRGHNDWTFAFQAPIALGGGSPFSLATDDLNSDGRLDLAVTLFSTNQARTFLGNGDLTFQTWRSPTRTMAP